MDDHPMAKRARKAAAEHLVHYAPWTWFCGLTFASPISESQAQKAFRVWRGQLAREVIKSHFRYGVSSDRQVCGRPHFHVLVAVPPIWTTPLEPGWARHVWLEIPFPTQTAFADWYDPERAGAKYMAEGHESTIWDIACPRTGDCKRSKCALDPGG
jgi:hypothetical protein